MNCQPKDGSGEPPAPERIGDRDFHGRKGSNATNAWTIDPGARLYRKPKAKLQSSATAAPMADFLSAWHNRHLERNEGMNEPQDLLII